MGNEHFQTLNDFLGFGEPEIAQYWFVGIEEGGSWKEGFEGQEEDLKKYEKGHFSLRTGDIAKDARKYGNSYTKTYTIISKLMCLVEGKKLSDWRQYRDEYLFTENNETFMANLFPLGKKHIYEWPKYYEPQFGLESKTRYLQEVRSSETGPRPGDCVRFAGQ